MSIPPKPEEPCTPGYYWQLVGYSRPPYVQWGCVPFDYGSLGPGPTPPAAPEDPAQWPWPLNYLQDFIVGAFSWVGDVVTWGVEGLQSGIDESFNDLGIDLTGIGDWLKLQIESLIKTSQGFLDERITATQVVTEKAIITTQGVFEEGIKDAQTLTEGAIKTTQGFIDERITATQAVTEGAITHTQGFLEERIKATQTVTEGVAEEVVSAIVAFINATAGPALKSLNDILEEV